MSDLTPEQRKEALFADLIFRTTAQAIAMQKIMRRLLEAYPIPDLPAGALEAQLADDTQKELERLRLSLGDQNPLIGNWLIERPEQSR